MINSNKQVLVQWAGCLAFVLIALTASDHNSVRCQFLQPQSHLGRLVQSITSPLVLASSSSGGDSDTSYDSETGGPSGHEDSSGRPQYHGHQQPARGYYQQQQQQQQQEAAGEPQHFQQYRAHQRQTAGLQQAPSQQRGIPQPYYGGQDDEDSGAPTNTRQHKHQTGEGGEQYRMGAYLGPTIDDKEIQGAFNSNDDKDEDEAAGYENPPTGGARGQRGAASAYAASQPDAAGYAPQAGAYDGARGPMRSGGQRGEQANFDDELGADEDDEPAAAPGTRPSRFKSSASMSQAAASQYHQRNQPSYPHASANNNNQQQQQQQQQRQQSSSMMAAANGYSPMGAAGPFDLSGLMAAAGGPANGAQAYEIYNGDGSYPGQGYYQQQGNQGQGRRNQAASMNLPYGYGQYGPMGYGQQQQQQQGGRNSDQDDAENDQDED